MENWIQRLFLTAGCVVALSASGLALGQAGGQMSGPVGSQASPSDDDELEQIITPDLQRRTVKEADLDSENFEIGIFVGVLSVEDFGSNTVQGATLAYHITERFFIEGTYANSRTQKTSYERLSGGVELLTDAQRDINYYTVALGYNFLPGQIYLSDKWAFNNNFYIVAGAGNTDFAANTYFTTSLGAGLRAYATDWLAVDLSMRAHGFSHELLGKETSTMNLESRLGLSVFF